MNFSSRHTTKGFTLIELLVVIAIIGLLSSVVLASVSVARARARDTRRMSDLHQIQNALEIYYATYSRYPNTFDSISGQYVFHGGFTGCYGGYGYATAGAVEGYIPGLAPAYISALPEDPTPDSVSDQCYLYKSDGTDYMIVAYKGSEAFNPNGTIYNRASEDSLNPLIYDSMAVYTPGAINW